MGCDLLTARKLTSSTCFNPRTRMGCDLVVPVEPQQVRVSIHAPAWGATLRQNNLCHTFRVSIHAPAWGATCNEFIFSCRKRVSIHAPAWGATLIGRILILSGLFQSTHPHGVRQSHSIPPPMPVCFNPRTRMGCDGSPSALPTTAPSFNPRTRMGCDLVKVKVLFNQFVSIHAPAWGATPSGCFTASFAGLFQSTHPHGVRLFQNIVFSSVFLVSIHAPAWGATYCRF